MKRKIVFAAAAVCLVAIIAVLVPTLAFTAQLDLTKINHFSWNGSDKGDEPVIDGNRYSMTVKKQFSSEAPSEAEQFSFVLKAADSKTPMPDGKSGGSYSFTINGADSVALPEIEYSSAGKYTYTVSEVDTALAGYTYDAAVYTVAVTVENSGGVKIADVEITMSKNGKDYGDLSEIAFTNAYTPTDKTGELPKMSDNTPIEMYIAVLIIAAAGFVGCCVYLFLNRNNSRYGKK